MDSVLISVIVPAYNMEKYIVRTLDSLLRQTHSHLEIIVIDDGSTDGTGEILEELSGTDERIRVHHTPNSGVTNARLTGCRMARGEWIGFADGDDIVDADMYQRLLQNAMNYHADISHCGFRMTLPNGKTNYYHNTGSLEQQDRVTALKELLSGDRIEPSLCNKLFHRELLQQLLLNAPAITGIRINEDLLMNFYLFSAADTAVYEDFCPYCYYARKESASRAKLNEHKIYDPIRVKQSILDIASSELQQAAQGAYLSTCVGVYNSLMLEGKHQFRKDRFLVRQLIREHRTWLSLLRKKQRFLACLILYTPWLYPILYRIYEKYFQKKKYE